MTISHPQKHTSSASPVHAGQRDPLTGLADAAAAQVRLSEWHDQAAKEGCAAPVHVLLLALGRFDAVNLAYGEAAGDGALVTVAQRIGHFANDELEDGDWIAARIGGGKFLLAVREACSRERWQWLGEALADAVALPIAGLGDAGTLRLWPRVALMRAMPGERPQVIFERAGEALDRAQHSHGQRVLWADGSTAPRGRTGAQLEADLLGALDREEIELVYQPQYRLLQSAPAGGLLVGAEALARWQHPMLGRIGASALFAIAERADHVAPLSRHIAERALRDAALWPKGMRLSLNVTPADLAAASFAAELQAVVASAGFSADRLTLEITEHVLLADLERSAAMLGKLRAGGMRIALDDFGAGFCNFRYLQILPLDYLKLDRAMVEGIADAPRDMAVFRAIVAMAKALSLQVIAEGIETDAQRDLIAGEGCEFYQGFIASLPMPAAEFAALARRSA
ncbi:GGDEF domain-containing phosphodiesterase [Allopontixanthobacter sediminis]|uniref:EAL domain-containing protein n=1 Tax=Allopontixanthobacter sediminis TaxID=1689985 RepID=A0A845B0U5_9SPHN|nr:GGDEF domain-containing phosphodiesterase [Allopontixanthobacter sediminis]MXP43806.1 EAL domain-containing protein [Allopontixanthobacter sediminis]